MHGMYVWYVVHQCFDVGYVRLHTHATCSSRNVSKRVVHIRADLLLGFDECEVPADCACRGRIQLKGKLVHYLALHGLPFSRHPTHG